MKKIRQIIKLINQCVSNVVLAVFYVFGIGLGHLIYSLFKKKRDDKSYWITSDNNNVDLSSPY
ncbi:hypothetical protein COY90_01645 [Candidatus Roizmanbacteria bacterium CG_4_10_14_0_8_um_filter_39_9]|uniref:Uncharacterized protein n=1 Tax=Candidatus Roizmanbacteria bacterium CG_4_10_14_0_8_um_filter_39_9 TaxID=1974829 RepID=A0A2M7QDF2_9BACT|nr:MAG: hypothetical protein COY90_01645 [Candidatus Roizmanbacteria bacterium CG_4_10_14_0_8_um_filter_39_9]